MTAHSTIANAPLTIVLTSYNYGHYIGDAIASVVRQGSDEWRLIIYDNRSTDNTYEVIEPFLADPRISLVIRDTNIGARNNHIQALRAVDSEFVATLQADDFLDATFVETALRELRTNPSAPFVFFNWNHYVCASKQAIYHDSLPLPLHRSGKTRIGPLLTIMNFVPFHMAVFRTTCLLTHLDTLIESPLTQLGEQFLLKLLEDAYGSGCFSGTIGGVWRHHSSQLTATHITSSVAIIEDPLERHWYASTRADANRANVFLALAAFVTISSHVTYPAAVDWLLSPTGMQFGRSYGLAMDEDGEHFRAMALVVALKFSTYTSHKNIDKAALSDWLRRMACPDTAAGLRARLEEVREREGEEFLNADEIDDAVTCFFRQHVQPAFNHGQQQPTYGAQPLFRDEYHDWVIQRSLSCNERALIENSLKGTAPDRLPRIYVSISAHGNAAGLQQTLDSVARQVVAPHEIVVVGAEIPGDPMPAPDIVWIPSDDANFYARRGWTGSDQWVLGLVAGDVLGEEAFYCLRRRIAAGIQAPIIYVDHDELDAAGRYVNPCFKPASNPDLLRSTPYTGRALLVRCDWLAREAEAPPRDLVAAYRLALRAVEADGEQGLVHEPLLAAHLTTDVASVWAATDEEHEALRGVLATHVDRIEPRSALLDGPAPGTFHWLPPLLSEPLVSIIIPTRDQAPLLKRCIQSLVEKTRYQNIEILIVDNDSQSSEALQFFDNIVRLLPDRVRILRAPGQFNFSRMNNLAAEAARGEYLLLLNNDTAALQADWLDHMMRHALRREVGAVGAALYFPNGNIQHAGVVLGLNGAADHPFVQLPPNTPGYQYRAQLQQDFSAVSGACLLVRKSLYEELGGLDEKHFAVSFNDIDFCLRIRARGKLVVWTPLAILLHDGSASQLGGVENLAESKKSVRYRAERTEMYVRWPELIANDPAYNPNLSLEGHAFSIETNPVFVRSPLDELRPDPLLVFLTDDPERARYRLIQPFEALRQEGFVSGALLDDVPAPNLILRSGARAVVFQQPRNLRQLEHMEALLAVEDITAVFDGDDMLWNRPFGDIPQDILPAEFTMRMEDAIRRCDRIVVSIAPLAQRLAGLNADIRVLPDLLHPSMWGDRPPTRPLRPGDRKPRIGWTDRACGKDIQLLADVIRELAEEVEWVCIGECPPSIKPWLSIHIENVGAPEYPVTLMGQDWDLAIAPLDDNAFNTCRSGVRLLEYGWSGFPVICSDVDAYRNELPAIRVANTPAQWLAAIRGATGNLETLHGQGIQLQQCTLQRRLLQGEALQAWYDALTQPGRGVPGTTERASTGAPTPHPAHRPAGSPATTTPPAAARGPVAREPVATAPAGATDSSTQRSTPERIEPDDAGYRHWLARRQPVAADLPLLAAHMRRWRHEPVFQLVLRTEKPQFPQLAATLESLNTQLYGNWHVDIVSTAPSPGAALDSLPNVTWNTIGAPGEAKSAIDMLVAARACDWIIELPPGAVLDPLCLYRVANDACNDGGQPPMAAWFADDDTVDRDAQRHAPRFKPAPDPDWMRCTDLTGPLFVAANAWRDAGGAAADAIRPWYDLALRITDALGEKSVGHIAEPLISLPETLRDDRHVADCMAAARRSLARRNIKARVLRVEDDVWRIEYPLRVTPMVTVAIPSRDKPEYLGQCVDMILSQTSWPDYEILIVDAGSTDPDTLALLDALTQRTESPVRCTRLTGDLNPASFANAAAREARGELLLLMGDDIRVTRPDWLTGLVRHAQRDEVACVAPILVSPPDGKIDTAGIVPGLAGLVGSPHQGRAVIGDAGYLNALLVDRSVGAVTASCMLLRTADFLAAGGMDETRLAAGLADVDLSLRLSGENRRCVVTASVALVRLGASCLAGISDSQKDLALRQVAMLDAQETMFERWFPALASDRWWSKHLDRSTTEPRLELRCIPAWHAKPWPAPRIVAFPVSNAQGLIRLTQPLDALQRSGKAHACVYQPLADHPGIPTVHDLARHRPDAIVAHQLLGEASLMTVHQWRRYLRDVFLVYSVDDLLTDMPQKSSLRQYIPADARSYLARTMPYFDRLVVSTAYLAETYGKFARDTRIVPNRLERDVWLPLNPKRRTSARPRVGWAGGTAHEGDLQLIADVVAATANDVDWIFMGMCPDNIRPYAREFHAFGDYAAYPQRLAALNLDLAVAPLEQIPFNRGKSNLRLLEYGALGIPVVCTDIDPYRDSPACRVPNTPRDWLDALRERIHDPDATAREGDAMRQWVLDYYILEDHLDSWLQAHLPS